MIGRVARTDVGALEIVIGRWQGDVALMFGRLVGLGVVFDEREQRALALPIEIAALVRIPIAPRGAFSKEHGDVGLHAEVYHEVDVESGRDGLHRIRPL